MIRCGIGIDVHRDFAADEVEIYDPGDEQRAHEDEEVLAGGDMTVVVRVGDTVRRRAGPRTATIDAFMGHLRASGFTMLPRPLGIDDRGREIISLLPGAVAAYPLPRFAWSDATLIAVAQVLRAFHDASVGFIMPRDGLLAVASARASGVRLPQTNLPPTT